jgi:hypothetical protein
VGRRRSPEVEGFQRLLDQARSIWPRLEEIETELQRSLPALEALMGRWRHVPHTCDWNAWVVSGLFMKEDRHSDLLRSLLDPAGDHGLGDRLLLGLLEAADLPVQLLTRVEAALGRYAVRRERSGASSRIDIEVEGADFLIHLENKRPGGQETARGGRAQTDREWDDLMAAAGRKGIQPSHCAAVFLTPSGANASSPRFHSLSWLDLAYQLRLLADAPCTSREVGVQLTSYADYLYRQVMS